MINVRALQSNLLFRRLNNNMPFKTRSHDIHLMHASAAEGYAENTHLWGKDHYTVGLQFNMSGTDQ